MVSLHFRVRQFAVSQWTTVSQLTNSSKYVVPRYNYLIHTPFQNQIVIYMCSVSFSDQLKASMQGKCINGCLTRPSAAVKENDCQVSELKGCLYRRIKKYI